MNATGRIGFLGSADARAKLQNAITRSEFAVHALGDSFDSDPEAIRGFDMVLVEWSAIEESARTNILDVNGHTMLIALVPDSTKWEYLIESGFTDVFGRELLEAPRLLETRIETHLHVASEPPHQSQALNLDLNSIPLPLFVLSEELMIQAVNELGADLTGYDPKRLQGRKLSDLVESDSVATDRAAELPGENERPDIVTKVQVISAQTGEKLPVQAWYQTINPPYGEETVVCVFQDIQERRITQKRLIQLQQQLELNYRFQNILKKTIRSILSQTTTDELEVVVTNQLVKADPYVGAVFGDYDEELSTFIPNTAAGLDVSELVDHLASYERTDGHETICEQAVRTGDVQIAEPVRSEVGFLGEIGTRFVPVAGAMAVIPIVYEDSVLGILAVYASRAGAFSQFEVDMFDELGHIIGYTHNAIETRRLLVADSVIEMEFEIRGEDSFFTTCSADAECELTLESIVPAGGEETLYYVTVTGAETRAVRDIAEESALVTSVEVLSQQGETGQVVFTLEGPTLPEQLSMYNANVSSLVASNGVARVHIEVAPGTKTDDILHTLRDRFSEVSLIAKRETNHPLETTGQFRHEIFEDLSERQQAALEAAYYFNYFTRPRETTAQEIAAKMDISDSTYHQHLRAALRKVLDVLLGEETRSLGPGN